MSTIQRAPTKRREMEIYEEELSMWLAVLSWTKRKFLVSEIKGEGTPLDPYIRTITYSSTDPEQRMMDNLAKELRRAAADRHDIS